MDTKRTQKKPHFTGFYEPFSRDRNTTLPHPDADTSPGACIEAPPEPLSTKSKNRSSSQRQQAIRHPTNRSKHSLGSIPLGADLTTMYENIQYEDGSVERKSTREIENEMEGRDDLVSVPSTVERGSEERGKMPNDSGVDVGVFDGRTENHDGYKTEKKRGMFGNLKKKMKESY